MSHKLKLIGGAAAMCLAVLAMSGSAFGLSNTVVKTTNDAGYSAIDPSAITSFSGTISVPTITCPSTGDVYISAGVGLSGGSEVIPLAWSAFCYAGTLSFNDAEAGFCPESTGICDPFGTTAIAAGDSIKFSMKENEKTDMTTVTVDNVTEGQKGSATLASSPSFTEISAETSITDSSSGSVTPIPSFTTINYGSLKFNGMLLSSLSPTEYKMYDGSTLQVSTSAINSKGSFSTTFKHV